MSAIKYRQLVGDRWHYWGFLPSSDIKRLLFTGPVTNQQTNPIHCQFTGLHDVTGEEIYEGDIVRWGHIAGYEEYNPRKAVVEFSPDLTFATFNLEKNNKFRFGNFAYRNTDDALEIIGNIYQNPELLNHG